MPALRSALCEGMMAYLVEELNWDDKDVVLLAVSGGADSMCLWNLFREAGLSYEVAHCNFQLRGQESDDDEEFVRAKVGKDEVFHSRKFDTFHYASEQGISIQMAARELRYAWFDELCEQTECTRVATAHHRDDEVETFFIQLLRRGNIDALKGIPPMAPGRLRPLLFTPKQGILEHLASHNISYREDSSNEKTDYLRNRIRHVLLPAIRETDAGYENRILDLMDEVRKVSEVLDEHLSANLEHIARREGGLIHLSIPAIQKLEFPGMFLSRYLYPMGFTPSVISDIERALDAQAGKEFHGGKLILYKDRNELIIKEIDKNQDPVYEVYKAEMLTSLPLDLKARLVNGGESYSPSCPDNCACFDYDKLDEHIIFRKWKGGDHFIPLGMKGKKKLSDFFINLKMPRPEKDDQWIMLSGDEICWIVGLRQDERFKITGDTKMILEVTYKEE